MIESHMVVIQNELGLHARPAAVVVKMAASCSGKVTFIKGDKRVNAKSLMSLLTANIKKGDEITVEIEDGHEGEMEQLIEVISRLTD